MRRHLTIAGASLAGSFAASFAALFAASLVTACASGTSGSPASPASSAVSSTAANTVARTATPTRGVFTLVHGADTIAAERFNRSADRLQVDFTSRGIVLFNYEASITPQATIARMQIVTHVPGTPERTSSVTFHGDSAILIEGAGESAKTLRTIVPQGTLPYASPSATLMEQIIRRARVIGGTSVAVPLLIASTDGKTASAAVSFSGPDSARMEIAGVTILLGVDAAGDILSGSVPSQGVAITRSAAAGAP
ncbi:MAG: hypothetical protein ACR2MQ_06520 [Gemmatimonadaceae bacterium]